MDDTMLQINGNLANLMRAVEAEMRYVENDGDLMDETKAGITARLGRLMRELGDCKGQIIDISTDYLLAKHDAKMRKDED